MIIEAWGMTPNEILSREALSRPNRTVVDMEQRQIGILNLALKEAIDKELARAFQLYVRLQRTSNARFRIPIM